MRILSLSEVKAKLSGLIEELDLTEEPLVITKKGRPAAVLVHPDEFESWRETIAIRNDTDLMDEIRQGLKELKAKRTRLYTLDELFTE